MNLYLISQSENTGYDTYDSAVVAAPTSHAARRMQPDGRLWPPELWCQDWATKPENVTVKLLGLARANIKQGVICASFNAG